MKKLWLLFSQVVTVLVACWFVAATLQPGWLSRIAARQAATTPAPAATLVHPPSETLRNAAKLAAPAVVSVIANPEQAEQVALKRREQGEPEQSDTGEEDSFSGMGSGVIVSPEG